MPITAAVSDMASLETTLLLATAATDRATPHPAHIPISKAAEAVCLPSCGRESCIPLMPYLNAMSTQFSFLSLK